MEKSIHPAKGARTEAADSRESAPEAAPAKAGKSVKAGKSPKVGKSAKPAKVGKPSTFSQYKTLLKKDLSREFRTKEMLTSMGIYALLVLVVYGASLGQSSSATDVVDIAGGLFWALIVFTSLLGLGRSFSAEKEQGCLEGILLVPMDRAVIFLAKATSNVLFLLVVEVIAVPLFCFFFLAGAHPADTVSYAIAPLLVGTVGIAGVGTLLSTITANTRGKDVMLAVLFVPVIFPLLYACAQATTAMLAGSANAFDVFVPSMALACGYDVIMLLASWALYDFVISA